LVRSRRRGREEEEEVGREKGVLVVSLVEGGRPRAAVCGGGLCRKR